jgi:hypothetical protein
MKIVVDCRCGTECMKIVVDCRCGTESECMKIVKKVHTIHFFNIFEGMNTFQKKKIFLKSNKLLCVGTLQDR